MWLDEASLNIQLHDQYHAYNYYCHQHKSVTKIRLRYLCKKLEISS